MSRLVPSRWVREGTFAALVMVGVAALCMYPSLPVFHRGLVGDLSRHPIDSAWLYWTTSVAVFDSNPFSLKSAGLQDPEYLDVLGLYADIGNAVLAAPAVQLFGTISAYNLAQLVQATLLGVSGFALARTAGLRPLPSLVSGLFSLVMEPFWFAVRWGEDDVAALWWIPAIFALVLRADRLHTEGPHPKHALLPAAAFGLLGWFNSYYLYFVALCLPILLAPQLKPSRFRTTIPAMLAFCATFGAVYLPRLAIGIRPSRMGERLQEGAWINELGDLGHPPADFPLSSALDLGALLNPISPSRLLAASRGQEEGVLYIGLAFLTFAVVGSIRASLTAKWRLLCVALLGLVLSLGSWLRFEGALLQVEAWEGLPMPQGILATFLPGMARMNHPYRFVNLFFFALAPLCAGGIESVGNIGSNRRRWATLLLLAALVLGERLLATPGWLPIRAWALRFPASYAQLPEPTRSGALMFVPWPERTTPFLDLEPSRYQRAAQVFHWQRPIYVQPNLNWLQGAVDAAQMSLAITELQERNVELVLTQANLSAEVRPVTANPMMVQVYESQAKFARINLSLCLGAPIGDERVQYWVIPSPPQTCK